MFSLFFPGFLPFSILAYFSLFLFVRVSNAAFAQCRMLSCCSEHPFFRLVFLANGWNLSSVAGGRCALRCTSHTREKVGSFLVSSVNKMCFETQEKGTGLQMSSNISVACYCCHLTYCCFPHASPHRRAHLYSSWSSALESFLQQPMTELLSRCLSHLRVAIKWKAQSCICSSIYISQHSDIWILIRYGLHLCIFQISFSVAAKNSVVQGTGSQQTQSWCFWHHFACSLGQIA